MFWFGGVVWGISEPPTALFYRSNWKLKAIKVRKKIRKYSVDLSIIKEEPLQPIMDGFDGILKLLHESTHDKEVRKSILIVQKYKTTYLDKKS